MTDALQIRPMTRAVMDRALDWAAEEGWNPGLDDAGCFRQADEGGFIAGFIDGQMVASISVVAYDHAFAFLGFYIVAPVFRGHGFGFALWRAGMARLGDRLIGLDGVVAQQDNYARSGFRLAWRNVRYEGRGGGQEPPGLVPLSAVPFAELAAYDSAAFPGPRDHGGGKAARLRRDPPLSRRLEDRAALRRRSGLRAGPLRRPRRSGAR